MGDVVELPVKTCLDYPPDTILANAIEAKFASVIVIGRTEAGDLALMTSSGDLPDILWDIEHAKREVLEQSDGED